MESAECLTKNNKRYAFLWQGISFYAPAVQGTAVCRRGEKAFHQIPVRGRRKPFSIFDGTAFSGYFP